MLQTLVVRPAAGLVCALVLAGCNMTPPDQSGYGQAASSPSAAPVSKTTPTPTSHPTTKPRTVAPSPTAVKTSPAPVPPTPTDCRASALAITASQAPRGRGMQPDDQFGFATDFTITSRASKPCVLNGWPGISAYGSGVNSVCEAGTTCELHPDKTTPQSIKVTHLPGAKVMVVPPRGYTVFTIYWEGVICLSSPYRLDFEVPGDQRPIPVVLPAVCLSPLEVTSFGSTS